MHRPNRRLQLVSPRPALEGAGLEALFRAYSGDVRRYIVSMFGNGPPDPEDVVQATFEKYASLEDTAEINDPKGFLLRTARNYVFDQQRRQAVRSRHAQSVEHEEDVRDDLDAERVLIAKQRWAVLEDAIHGLDERHQEMLIMNRVHGLSYADIARQKGCSQTLVKKIVAQALVHCERALREADVVK